MGLLYKFFMLFSMHLKRAPPFKGIEKSIGCVGVLQSYREPIGLQKPTHLLAKAYIKAPWGVYALYSLLYKAYIPHSPI
jgi:hypothetical protein